VGVALVELESRLVPTYYGNQVFPLDNPWNEKVTNAPVSANSAAIMNYLVNTRGNARVHPDFGNPATDGALYGIPVNVVDSTTPKVQVVVPSDGYPDESDSALVLIPANAVVEGDDATGPSLVTDRGDFHIFSKSSPYKFVSPWPPGSPFWYHSAWVSWAMEIVGDGTYLHDAPWQPDGTFGPGSENGPYSSHGCIHVPSGVMRMLFSWAPIGTEVLVGS